MLSDDDDENSAILPSVQPDAFPDSNEEDDLTGFQSRRSQWANRIDSSENESSPSEGASRDRGLSNEAQNIIQETYRAVWTEFYEWEPSHSSQTLRSLASESHSRPAASDYGLEDLDWCIETGQVVYGGLDTDAEQFDVWQWTDEGTAQHLVTLPTETIISEEAVIPHPSYEACTPCHSNIDGGTDGSKPHCKFIKYAGQPGFDERGYLRLFRFIEWQQQPWRDPDHLIIAFTTIQRLTALSGNGIAPSIPIYVDDIDDSQIFYQYQGSISNYTDDPFPVVEITFSMRGRDDLDWPGNTFGKGSCHAYTPSWRGPPRHNDTEKLVALTSMLCPNLHCLETECFAHTYSTGWCPSSTQEDVNTNEAMLAKVKRAPCGDSCFLDLHTPEIQNSIDWESEPEVEALDAILQLSPNTLPCSLITLVPQTQCYKIFARRSRIIQGSEPKESEARSSENRAPLFFNDVDVAVKATTFVIPVRCAHKGDCGPTSVPKCECYTNGVHCRRNCQCSQRCVRRYKGCRCARGMHLCAPGKRSCMCRIMGRECDPEVCKHSLPAKGNKGKAVRKVHPKCSNFEFQRSSPVCLVVRAGRYGLGTFAGQTIHRDAFLGTYIGETFWTEDDELRKPESTYNGLNYMFAHTSTQYIDAQSAGNETRYINHASKEMANVAAEFRLVNGEQQIGFFATKTIKPNQELFFDYGPAYWSRG